MKVYHKADIVKTMNSMKKFLDSYEANTDDENLVDSISMETQSEMICNGMAEWPCAPNVCQIMVTIPLMIRTVTIGILPRNITKNPSHGANLLWSKMEASVRIGKAKKVSIRNVLTVQCSPGEEFSLESLNVCLLFSSVTFVQKENTLKGCFCCCC